MNIYKSFQAFRAGLFFSNFFDLVIHYEVYSANSKESMINPVSDVFSFDGQGRQPIHLAVETGKLGAVTVLIEQFGADINAINQLTGLTPLILSITHSQIEIFHYILSLADLNLSTTNFKSPLHFAAELGNLEIVEALVTRGAKISYLRGTRQTPLHVAMTSGKVETVRWFIEHNLGIGPVCRDRNSPLESTIHFLARQRLTAKIWAQILEIYLKGVNNLSYSNNMNNTNNYYVINRRSLAGLSPLQVASEEGNEVAMIGLIVFGADLEPFKFENININQSSNVLIRSIRELFQKNNYIFSPDYVNEQLADSIWHIAARTNSIALIQCTVLRFPLKPNLRLINSEGLTPLDVAVKLERFEIAVELIQLYDHVIELQDLERFVNLAIWNSFFVLLETLIQEFLTDFSDLIDSVSSSQSGSFLHILIIVSPSLCESTEMKRLVLLFLKYFPKLIRSRDQFGRTPMHLALECGYLQFLEWFKEAKVENPELNFDIPDSSGLIFFYLLKDEEDNAI